VGLQVALLEQHLQHDGLSVQRVGPLLRCEKRQDYHVRETKRDQGRYRSSRRDVTGSRTDLTWPNLMVSPADGAATTQTVESRKARFMAIPRGHQFEIEFDSAFPQGLVLIGDVAPDNEYQTREDKAAGRPVRQKIDNMTGQRQWKATVTDPDEPNAKRTFIRNHVRRGRPTGSD
jgi:hypothetical protein